MPTELTNFLIAAGVNLAAALLIVRGIYFPVTKNKHYVFSFLVFNTMIFSVLSLLGSVELSVGLGLGLFAIFSVLNYRTDQMPIREMTYLFTLIALPVMNAFMLSGANLSQVLAANGLVIGAMYALEKGWGFRCESNHRLTYDNLELITPDNRERLLDDLRARTGLPVKRVDIARIDFVRDTAEITMYFDEPRQTNLASRNDFQLSSPRPRLSCCCLVAAPPRRPARLPIQSTSADPPPPSTAVPSPSPPAARTT